MRRHRRLTLLTAALITAPLLAVTGLSASATSTIGDAAGPPAAAAAMAVQATASQGTAAPDKGLSALPGQQVFYNEKTPDPGFTKAAGRYWVLTTGSRIKIFSSARPTRGYVPAGHVFSADNTNTKGASLWAPTMFRQAGRWYVVFAARKDFSKNKKVNQCLYYTWSDQAEPKGFHANPVKLLCEQGWKVIDPDAYQDENGTWQLAWRRSKHAAGQNFQVGDFQIMSARLTFDGANRLGLGVPTPRTAIIDPLVENPSLVKTPAGWRLLVSRGNFAKDTYRTELWEPTAPGSQQFAYKSLLMKSGQGFGQGPGAADIIREGGKYYIAYAENSTGERHTRIVEAAWQNGTFALK